MAPRRRRMRRRPAKKAGGSKATKALVRSVAKKVISSQLEDKYVGYTLQPAPPGTPGYPISFNASITVGTELYPLLPPLLNGASSYQRVGDRIRPKRFYVDVIVSANGGLTSSQLNMVRLFLLCDKALGNWDDVRVNTPITQDLLNNGAGTQGFTGIPHTLCMPVNTERYKVLHDKVLQVRAGTGQTPNSTNGYVGSQTFVGTQQAWKLRFNIPTPAVLKYSGFNNDYPSNFAPFICLGYIQPDGNASPDNLITRVQMSYRSHLWYEDA